MFKHLLVPLDGTLMSETAIPIADYLARQQSADVTLLHVLEDSAQPVVHGQPHLTDYEHAVRYLEQIANGRFTHGVRVGYHVHREPVKALARDLARHAEVMRQDLIILCAHGEVRLRDRFLGNIAQQITETQDIPVLMLQSQTGSAPCPFQKVLILVDGKPEHESAIVPAIELAKACAANVIFMHVVEVQDTLHPAQSVSAAMLPNTAMELAQLTEFGAAEYLQSLVERFQKDGLSVSGCVDQGRPIQKIVDYVLERKVDLIVLGTHGKAGTQAFWAGTLPPKLMRKLPEVSFLLVPAAGRDASTAGSAAR